MLQKKFNNGGVWKSIEHQVDKKSKIYLWCIDGNPAAFKMTLDAGAILEDVKLLKLKVIRLIKLQVLDKIFRKYLLGSIIKIPETPY